MTVKLTKNDPSSSIGWRPNLYAQGCEGYVATSRQYFEAQNLPYRPTPTPYTQTSSLSERTTSAPATPTSNKVTTCASNSPLLKPTTPSAEPVTIQHALPSTSPSMTSQSDKVATCTSNSPSLKPKIPPAEPDTIQHASSSTSSSITNRLEPKNSSPPQNSFASALAWAATEVGQYKTNASQETQPKTFNILSSAYALVPPFLK